VREEIAASVPTFGGMEMPLHKPVALVYVADGLLGGCR